MALTYSCPSCGRPIVVKFLKIGDLAQCKNCGKLSPVRDDVIPPSDLSAPSLSPIPAPLPAPPLPTGEPTASERVSPPTPPPSPSEPPVNAGKSAWDPNGLRWLALLFSYPPALVLAAYNWKRLGSPEKKNRYIIIAAVTFPLYVAVALLIPREDSQLMAQGLIALLNYSIGYYLTTVQRPAFVKFTKSGGVSRSYLRPVLLSLVIGIGSIILIFGVSVMPEIYYSALFTRGMNAFESNQYRKARYQFEALEEHYGDEPKLWYYEGLSYLGLKDAARAGKAFLRGISLDSGNVEFKSALTYVHDVMNWHPSDGVYDTWYDSGIRKVRYNYSQGKLHGVRIEYWSDGSIRRRMTFSNGRAEGPFELWNRDGTQLAAGTALDGAPEGVVLGWQPDATTPETTAVYDHGKLVSGLDIIEWLK